MKKYPISTIYLITSMFAISLSVGFIFYIIFAIKEGFEEKAKKYLDGVDIIYWINLDRSTDRKASMEEMLKDEAFNGIPNQRIKAYDGKMDPESVFKKFTLNIKRQTSSEYACLLSHLETIRTFNESQYNVALIFEDDVTLEFKKYWKKTVKEIMDNAPFDWEIIMITYTILLNPNVLLYDWTKSDQDYVENENGKQYKQYYGTVSYLINKKGSSKLMEMYENGKYRLNDKYDQTADIYIYGTLKTYVYKYPMFTYKTINDSNIHENHLQHHVQSKNNIINNYNKMEDGK